MIRQAISATITNLDWYDLKMTKWGGKNDIRQYGLYLPSNLDSHINIYTMYELIDLYFFYNVDMINLYLHVINIGDVISNHN